MERGLPNQIDASLWDSYSPAIRSQLLSTFRFLGLMDPRGRPTSVLRTLVDHRSSRPEQMRKLIELSYRPVISLDLRRATPKQFREAMSKFAGVTAATATHKKIISFFLKAAKYSGLPMAPALIRKSAVVRRQSSAAGPEEMATLQAMTDDSQRQIAKSVTLKSGGTLTLCLTANLLDLSSSDRALVFGIIDSLQSYEHGRKSRDA
jgi:hypothetical protein